MTVTEELFQENSMIIRRGKKNYNRIIIEVINKNSAIALFYLNIMFPHWPSSKLSE